MSERHPVRVLLADDHVTVRHGLRLLVEGEPDMTVVGEASDGAAAVKLALECKPDVVVMDVSMPGVNGLVATRMLKKILPGVAIVTLTRHADDAYLQELLRAGASGYVLKQSPPAELLQAIRSTAIAAGKYVDSSLMPRVTARFAGEKVGGSAGTVSEREAEVLRLIACGYSNKEIASQLDISVKTVEAHKERLKEKLKLQGSTELVRFAVQFTLDQANNEAK